MNTTNEMAHFNWREIFALKKDEDGNDPPLEIIEALDRYFKPFAAVPVKVAKDGKTNIGDIPCVNCGKVLNPGILGVLLGDDGFEWGMAHGEGNCSHCYWPARAIHYIKNDKGELLLTLRNFVIPYHSDYVSARANK